MNDTEMLALGEAFARTAEVLHPGERVPFRDYLRRVLDGGGGQIAALWSDPAVRISVDGRPVESPDSALGVTASSRVVLSRRRGAMLDVLNRGVARRICLN
jgi:hypothetical protein